MATATSDSGPNWPELPYFLARLRKKENTKEVRVQALETITGTFLTRPELDPLMSYLVESLLEVYKAEKKITRENVWLVYKIATALVSFGPEHSWIRSKVVLPALFSPGPITQAVVLGLLYAVKAGRLKRFSPMEFTLVASLVLKGTEEDSDLVDYSLRLIERLVFTGDDSDHPKTLIGVEVLVAHSALVKRIHGLLNHQNRSLQRVAGRLKIKMEGGDLEKFWAQQNEAAVKLSPDREKDLENERDHLQNTLGLELRSLAPNAPSFTEYCLELFRRNVQVIGLARHLTGEIYLPELVEDIIWLKKEAGLRRVAIHIPRSHRASYQTWFEGGAIPNPLVYGDGDETRFLICEQDEPLAEQSFLLELAKEVELIFYGSSEHFIIENDLRIEEEQ